jgi:predicted nucleic acid-binding protein
MTRVVDASVALKWFVAEPDSTIARGLVASGEPLIAPDLVVAEACNAAWRLARRGEILVAQMDIIATDLPRAFVELVPLAGLAASATTIARELDHPVYDCFYLALAVARDTAVVTADDRLIGRARGSIYTARITKLEEIAASPAR